MVYLFSLNGFTPQLKLERDFMQTDVMTDSIFQTATAPRRGMSWADRPSFWPLRQARAERDSRDDRSRATLQSPVVAGFPGRRGFASCVVRWMGRECDGFFLRQPA